MGLGLGLGFPNTVDLEERRAMKECNDKTNKRKLISEEIGEVKRHKLSAESCIVALRKDAASLANESEKRKMLKSSEQWLQNQMHLE